jgi:hypothetical protein
MASVSESAFSAALSPVSATSSGVASEPWPRGSRPLPCEQHVGGAKVKKKVGRIDAAQGREPAPGGSGAGWIRASAPPPTRMPPPARGLVSWWFKEQARGVGRRNARSLCMRSLSASPRCSPSSSSGLTRGPRKHEHRVRACARHGRRFWTGPAALPPRRRCRLRNTSHAALAPGPYYPEGDAGPAPRVRGSRNPRPQAPHPLPPC